jgi:2-amino-4-hydroxy-6-hydroxymethyldihydropteridine diphosphokinase
MNKVFLCLGGNMGERLLNIEKSLIKIEESVGEITKKSKVYETESWGKENELKYLNQVIEIKTEKNAKEVLYLVLKIEHELGRTRSGKWESRIIDIDILFFNSDIIQTNELIVPHPFLHQRNFVLIPLSEIANDFIHPILNETIEELKNNCEDKLIVKKIKSETNYNYICIEGNIGAGKTTIAKRLALHYNAEFLPEEFEENFLLPLFYKNKKEFAFSLEFSFLLDRFRQLSRWQEKIKNKTVFSDYFFEKCLYFAKVNLSKKEYLIFENEYSKLSQQIQSPDLLIYFQTSSANLLKNIKKRGRAYELTIPESYILKMNEQYKIKSTLERPFSILNIMINELDDVGYEKIYMEIIHYLKVKPTINNLQIEL